MRIAANFKFSLYQQMRGNRCVPIDNRNARNKRPMGHIVNMRKTKREKNYDYQADWLEVAINSSWKGAWFNLWRNLNPIYQKMVYAKFVCNWPWGSGEIFFLNVVRVLSSYHDYLLLEKGVAVHLNKIE